MKKLLMAAMLAIATMSAFASQPKVDTNGLSDEQVAKLQAQVTEMKAPVSTAEAVRTETEKWMQLGGNIGIAAGSAAKEIGIAANEFVRTPLGTATMAIVIYKIVGRDILHIFIGMMVLIVGISLTVAMYRRLKFNEFEYTTAPVLFGLWSRQVISKKVLSNNSSDGGLEFACVLICSAVTIASMSIIFS